MCYELCGPPIDGTPEDMADYEMWLGEEGPYAPYDPFEEDENVEVSVEEEDEEESNTISEREALERFDDFLNECWETVHICGYDYDPARALKQCDEVAYREEFNNWLDNELREGSFKLED